MVSRQQNLHQVSDKFLRALRSLAVKKVDISSKSLKSKHTQVASIAPTNVIRQLLSMSKSRIRKKMTRMIYAHLVQSIEFIKPRQGNFYSLEKNNVYKPPGPILVYSMFLGFKYSSHSHTIFCLLIY